MLVFWRGNKIPELNTRTSKQEMFSVCGKLLEHYLIAEWLQTSSNFIKRQAKESGGVKKTTVMMQEVLERVAVEDLVRGNWYLHKLKNGLCGVMPVA